VELTTAPSVYQHPRPTAYRIGGDVKAPVVIHRVAPDWSKLPRHFRVSGIVILEAVIDEEGQPVDIRILHGQRELADPAAEAMRKWKFKPGTLNGVPVRVVFNMTVTPYFR